MTVAAQVRPSDEIETMISRLQPRLARLFSHVHIPPQDAEDILQEALLVLVSKREQVKSPELWLAGTVRNHCLLYWRARRRRLYENVDAGLLDLVAIPQQAAQERSDASRDLAAVISQLPARCRSILKLRYAFGCGAPEVAERLGYRPSSIRKVTLRCLSALTRQITACGLAARKEP
jgi:RNA polymerase sigma factor (sigma-70 family)